MQKISAAEALKILDLKIPTNYDAIKKAYRSKARSLHPDLFQNETDKTEATLAFIRLKAASESLLSLSEYELIDAKILKQKHQADRESALRKSKISIDWPILYDLENIVESFAGFRMSNLVSKFFRINQFSFPNKFKYGLARFSGKIKSGDKGYLIHRLFKLLFTALLFICYIILFSTFLVLLLFFFLPSFLFFFIFYWQFNFISTKFLWKKASLKRPDLTFMFNQRQLAKKYIFIRFLAWFSGLLPLLAIFYISLSPLFITLLSIYFFMWTILVFSVFKELRDFNKVNSFRKKK